jgi:uncharacterized membrane protein YraQ (UPF0718 family)
MSSEKTTVTKGPKFIDSLSRAGKSMVLSVPIIFSLLLLFGWMQVFLPRSVLLYLFRGNTLSDTLTGAVLGSIFTGNAANSYIIGGELLQRGVSLFAVAAFITAWVTVGIVQLPAEIAFLGRRFSITRNCISLVLAVMVAVAAVWTWKVF